MNRVSRAAYSINRSLVQTTKYAKQEQLYLHQFNSNLTTISFSQDSTKEPIGTVSTNGLIGNDLSKFTVTPQNFKENKDFFTILNKTFFEKVYEDQTYIFDAMNYPGSYMAIGDYKIILDYMNQRPDLSNTIGFVHVDFAGQMEIGSYEPNEMYTLCNIDGIITLSENMNDQLQKYL